MTEIMGAKTEREVFVEIRPNGYTCTRHGPIEGTECSACAGDVSFDVVERIRRHAAEFGDPKVSAKHEPTEHIGGAPLNSVQAKLDRQARAKEISPGGDHYRQMGEVQPIDLIESAKLGFHEGAIIKYVARWRLKNGVQDLEKARWYIDRLIAQQAPYHQPSPAAPAKE